jgi:uncharacterized protein YqgV (UPF0045/DUF77 family)
MQAMIEVEVLEYDQLPKKIRQNLLWKEAEALAEIWQSDFVEDQFKEKAEAIGFSDVKVWYSGFGNQGDGACFDADVDLKKVLDHLGIPNEVAPPETAIELEWSCHIETICSRYNHERTRKIVFEILDEDNPKLEEEIGEKIEELRLELCRQLYIDLEADYSSSMSDEECLQYLRARRFVVRDELDKLITEKVPCEGVRVI